MGKITVVKTFALPKLIYPLTLLENPPVDILKKIKFEVFNFKWDSKPDKERGTQVDKYRYFIEALKAGWVRRIFDEQNKGI